VVDDGIVWILFNYSQDIWVGYVVLARYVHLEGSCLSVWSSSSELHFVFTIKVHFLLCSTISNGIQILSQISYRFPKSPRHCSPHNTTPHLLLTHPHNTSHPSRLISNIHLRLRRPDSSILMNIILSGINELGQIPSLLDANPIKAIASRRTSKSRHILTRQ
jgi:hypothetical protein